MGTREDEGELGGVNRNRAMLTAKVKPVRGGMEGGLE